VAARKLVLEVKVRIYNAVEPADYEVRAGDLRGISTVMVGAKLIQPVSVEFNQLHAPQYTPPFVYAQRSLV
jgi:hypothetical protein